MSAIRVIFEKGVFRPITPISLPESAEFEVDPLPVEQAEKVSKHQASIREILSRRYETGQSDLAARHNEHQP
jgi:predicted DNA-binding antitoxin AbrB/MazE fold protein